MLTACQSENLNQLAPDGNVSAIPKANMDRLPASVVARLARDNVDVAALEELIERQPENARGALRKLIASDNASWGLSAPPGSPDSYLLDRAFGKVKGYQKINR
jgi:hypothetical protein